MSFQSHYGGFLSKSGLAGPLESVCTSLFTRNGSFGLFYAFKLHSLSYSWFLSDSPVAVPAYRLEKAGESWIFESVRLHSVLPPFSSLNQALSQAPSVRSPGRRCFPRWPWAVGLFPPRVSLIDKSIVIGTCLSATVSHTPWTITFRRI